jgi:hypothetical protein
LWNSRKFFKKVTNELFPNKINGIFAPALARRPLIRHGEQVFIAISSRERGNISRAAPSDGLQSFPLFPFVFCDRA